jgi:cytochrome P450
MGCEQLDWDPYSVELDREPYPVWNRLRDEAPVYRHDGLDFSALSRFDDVEAASLSPAVFSSAHGTVLERMGPDPAGGGMMIFQDPPEHTTLRRVVSRAFSPRRIAELENRVRGLCRDLLEPHVHSPGFDYVTGFADQLPSLVISSLVRVPAADQETQRRHVDGMFHIEPGVGMANAMAAESALALAGYLADLVEQRSRNPRDDLMSDQVGAEVAGGNGDGGAMRSLTTDECVRFAILLYTAGTETVAKLLGNAAVILAGHDGQRRELAQRPELIPRAVEELLRYEAPSPVNGRWTTQPVTLHRVTIPAGSKVLLLSGSAGRDERAFDDPDQFDIHRENARHLSFGHGIHFCIGAALARIEGRIALEETLVRFPDWRIDPARLVRAHTSTVRGYRSVPIIV